jgi:hypothetical protein
VVDFLAKPVFAFWLISVYNKKYAPAIEGFWSNGLDSINWMKGLDIWSKSWKVI